MKNDVDMNSKYTKFIPGAEFLGLTPVENKEQYDNQSVVSQDTNKNVVPVFGIPSPIIIPTYSTAKKEIVNMEFPGFIFSSEKGKLEHKNKEIVAGMKKKIEENPYVIVFVGKKSQQGMRFKNKEEALELMNSFEFFDEIAQEEGMEYVK